MIARSAEGGGPLLVHPLLVCVYSLVCSTKTPSFSQVLWLSQSKQIHTWNYTIESNRYVKVHYRRMVMHAL